MGTFTTYSWRVPLVRISHVLCTIKLTYTPSFIHLYQARMCVRQEHVQRMCSNAPSQKIGAKIFTQQITTLRSSVVSSTPDTPSPYCLPFYFFRFAIISVYCDTNTSKNISKAVSGTIQRSLISHIKMFESGDPVTAFHIFYSLSNLSFLGNVPVSMCCTAIGSVGVHKTCRVTTCAGHPVGLYCIHCVETVRNAAYSSGDARIFCNWSVCQSRWTNWGAIAHLFLDQGWPFGFMNARNVSRQFLKMNVAHNRPL